MHAPLLTILPQLVGLTSRFNKEKEGKGKQEELN